MRQQKIYGYRTTAQGITVYNDTAEMYKQGSVHAALLPNQMDTHEIRCAPITTSDASYVSNPTCYVTQIENFPLNPEELTASTTQPYVAKAADGCYMVNRNVSEDWSFRTRNLPWEKSFTTSYATSSSIEPIAPESNPSYNFLGLIPPGVAVDAPVIPKNGSAAYAPLDELTLSGLRTIGNKFSKITGSKGTGWGVGVIWFSGLSEQSSFTLKMTHAYEFIVKPQSPLVPYSREPALSASWAFDLIQRQLIGKCDAHPARDNFFGALLAGVKTLLPTVLPLVGKLFGVIGRKVTDKGEKMKRQAADRNTRVVKAVPEQPAIALQRVKRQADSASRATTYTTASGLKITRKPAQGSK